jgi:hypothetical protein
MGHRAHGAIAAANENPGRPATQSVLNGSNELRSRGECFRIGEREAALLEQPPSLGESIRPLPRLFIDKKNDAFDGRKPTAPTGALSDWRAEWAARAQESNHQQHDENHQQKMDQIADAKGQPAQEPES